MDESSSIRRCFEIKNQRGMHARAATQLVNMAKTFDAEITIGKDGQIVNGKSIIGLLMLAAGKGERIEVCAEGPQAHAAVDAIGDLIDRLFDEGE